MFNDLEWEQCTLDEQINCRRSNYKVLARWWRRRVGPSPRLALEGAAEALPHWFHMGFCILYSALSARSELLSNTFWHWRPHLKVWILYFLPQVYIYFAQSIARIQVMILPNLNQLALTSASGSSTVTDIIELDSISESNISNPFEESMFVIQPELSQFGGSMNLKVSTIAQRSGKSQIIVWL